MIATLGRTIICEFSSIDTTIIFIVFITSAVDKVLVKVIMQAAVGRVSVGGESDRHHRQDCSL